jgi:glucuronosyltransferase
MSAHVAMAENPAYLPHPYLRYSDRWDFFDRAENTFLYLHSLLFYKLYSEYVFDRVALKFFGPSIPPIGQVIRNASMMFLNTHHSFNKARPMVPNVVDVGGINVKPAKPLSKVRTIKFC